MVAGEAKEGSLIEIHYNFVVKATRDFKKTPVGPYEVMDQDAKQTIVSGDCGRTFNVPNDTPCFTKGWAKGQPK